MKDDSGKFDNVDRRTELMLTALALLAAHPEDAAAWYAELDPHELQMLAAAIGEVLMSINVLISSLRGVIVAAPPELRRAVEALEPLLNIPPNEK